MYRVVIQNGSESHGGGMCVVYNVSRLRLVWARSCLRDRSNGRLDLVALGHLRRPLGEEQLVDLVWIRLFV